MVVRMAVLYELLAGGERPAPPRRAATAPADADPDRAAGMSARRRRSTCARRGARDLVLRRATRARPGRRHRRRPRRRRPRRRDRRARRARRAPTPTGAEVVEAEGLHAFPAFFDPHVHLRTPGQEHKEDLETGTRAAAAGGYCGDHRDAQHRPRSRPRPTSLRSLREQARAERLGPGRLPRHRHARHGGRGADRDGRAARGGRARLHRRRPAGRQRPACCARRSSTSGSAAA